MHTAHHADHVGDLVAQFVVLEYRVICIWTLSHTTHAMEIVICAATYTNPNPAIFTCMVMVILLCFMYIYINYIDV